MIFGSLCNLENLVKAQFRQSGQYVIDIVKIIELTVERRSRQNNFIFEFLNILYRIAFLAVFA